MGYEHRLERTLQRDHLGVEVARGDQVNEQVLDVVERRTLGERGGKREDLLAKEKALFVV